MITFSYDCPYCKTRSVAFTVTGFKKYALSNGVHSSLMANCNRCKYGVITNFFLTRADTARLLESSSIAELSTRDLSEILDVSSLKFSPSPEPLDIPEHLPEDVEAELKNAEQLFALNGMENNFTKPAGNAYRTALEKALCHLADNPNRARLDKRIEKLFDDGKLTKDLKNFALHIRSLSAEASHAYNDFTLDELEELRLFIKLFLQYTFTLPAMIPEALKAD